MWQLLQCFDWGFTLEKVVVPLLAAGIGAGAAICAALYAVNRSLYREALYSRQNEAYIEIAESSHNLIKALYAYIDLRITNYRRLPKETQDQLLQPPPHVREVRDEVYKAFSNFERDRRRLDMFFPNEVRSGIDNFHSVLKQRLEHWAITLVTPKDVEAWHAGKDLAVEDAFSSVITSMRDYMNIDWLSDERRNRRGTKRWFWQRGRDK